MDQQAVLLEDGAFQGQLTAVDPEGQATSITLAMRCLPRHGTVELLPGGSRPGAVPFRYIPDPQFSGTDSFAFIASDGEADAAGLVSRRLDQRKQRRGAASGALTVCAWAGSHRGSAIR